MRFISEFIKLLRFSRQCDPQRSFGLVWFGLDPTYSAKYAKHYPYSTFAVYQQKRTGHTLRAKSLALEESRWAIVVDIVVLLTKYIYLCGLVTCLLLPNGTQTSCLFADRILRKEILERTEDSLAGCLTLVPNARNRPFKRLAAAGTRCEYANPNEQQPQLGRHTSYSGVQYSALVMGDLMEFV